MITDRIKAAAIARLSTDEDLESISSSMDIPIAVLRDWQKTLPPASLITLEANNLAMSRVLAAPISTNTADILKAKILDAAIEVAEQVRYTASSGDIAYATALNRCANTLTSLYETIVAHSATVDTVNPIDIEGTLLD